MRLYEQASLIGIGIIGLVQAVDFPGVPWTICANTSTTCAQQNVTFAYLVCSHLPPRGNFTRSLTRIQYSYPLWPYGLYVRGTENASTNTIYNQVNLSTAADTALVKPNVDTLYSRVFLDLSSSDLAITIPDIHDRYWVCSLSVVFSLVADHLLTDI